MTRPSILAFALAIATLAAEPAAASELRRGWLELAIGPFGLDTVIQHREIVVAARGGLRLSDRWALEAAISRSEDDFTFGDRESESAELSARYSVRRGDTWDFFVIAGPGFTQVTERFAVGQLDEQGFPVLIEESDDALSVHVGAGVQIDLGSRWYLRPEIRQRWTGGRFESTQREGTLAVGWRF